MTRENESIDDVEKELAAEIAAINASHRSREDLVRELALTKLILRNVEAIAAYREDAHSLLEQSAQIAREAAALFDAEWQKNAELKNQQSKLVSLLPKAFEAGKKSLAKAGASATHAETRAMKQDVFAWLDVNPPKPRGKSAAATAIAAKVAPVVFTTALKWVNEWEKLRSTGTV